jgi:hypothetical protein
MITVPSEVSGVDFETAPAPIRRGAAPLPQALVLAPLLRRVAGLALALEAETPALAELIEQLRTADKALTELAPADLGPRLEGGDGAGAGDGDRVYLDHSHDIGAYNPGFPEYAITIDGDNAAGTVTFPLVFEGPPGMVHGGALALFFDAVVQQHNCELGIAGRTVSLHVDYKRPSWLERRLEFEIHRSADGDRSTSQVSLHIRGERPCCIATVVAVVGDVSRLRAVSPRGITR